MGIYSVIVTGASRGRKLVWAAVLVLAPFGLCEGRSREGICVLQAEALTIEPSSWLMFFVLGCIGILNNCPICSRPRCKRVGQRPLSSWCARSFLIVCVSVASGQGLASLAYIRMHSTSSQFEGGFKNVFECLILWPGPVPQLVCCCCCWGACDVMSTWTLSA